MDIKTRIETLELSVHNADQQKWMEKRFQKT